MLFRKKTLRFSMFFLFLPAIALAITSESASAETNMTHRMMMLAIQLGLITIAAKIGGRLFERVNIPAVLGELSAGMLIGPYALGGISIYGFEHGIFPVHSASFPISPELYGFASVAAILLLFMVGLETDINLFKRFYRAGVAVGIGGVFFSFALGDLTMVFFGEYVLGRSIGFMHPAALFLGAISSATSVGITARILSEKHKIASPEGVTILAGAVIDDVLGIIVLAIVLGVISVSQAGGIINWFDINLIAVRAIGIWLIVTFTGLTIAGKISSILKKCRGKTAIAVMALSLALLLSGFFEQVGLAMIIGAYVMGLSLSKTDINHVVQDQLHFIYHFLIPIFFCVMGMLVDFSAISSAPLLIFGLIYSLIAIFAKVIGSGIPSLFFNFNLRGAIRIGVGMLPRGEVALIMAGVGLAAGAFEPKLFGVSVLMVLITTMAAPPVLVNLIQSPKRGTRKSVKTKENTKLSFPFPTEEITALLSTKVLKTFEFEGFFVSLIDLERQQYQMRKENVIINYIQEPKNLIFQIDDSEIPLINTIMYEAIAELEKTIQGLQKPFDKEIIGKKLLQSTDKGGMKYKLCEHLNPNVIIPELSALNKKAVLQELLRKLKKAGKIADFDQAWQAIWDREETMSTGMEHGIAIPHGRTDTVSEIVCAVGIKKEGIDFGSIDGKPSRIFVLILTPKTKHSPFLQFLSQISRKLSDQTLRNRLLASRNPKELFDILTGEGEDVY
jgi:fructose-specific phosphotransferase system IIA component